MTYEDMLDLYRLCSGLTLEQWRVIRAEIDQQFEGECLKVRLTGANIDEASRLTAMRMDLYRGAEEARQTKLSF